jgi:flagellar biosynthesis protein
MSTSEQEFRDFRDMKAAALKYNADKDAAPIVVAAGTGFVAQRILEIAGECGVQIYHDDSAATLLSKLELGQSVPPELYQMIVEIYLSVLSAADAAKQARIAPKMPKGGAAR